MAASRVDQPAPHVVDALAAEPARVRSREPLLLGLSDLRRDVAAHRLAQQQLAVARALEEALGLRPGLVLVEAHDLGQVAELEPHRHALRELDQVVVEERHPRLEPVRHRQLVLDHQQAVQERLGLEVERVVDVVLRARELSRRARRTRRGRCRARRPRPSSAAIGREHPLERVLGQQPLPEAVVLVDVVVEVVVHDGAVVAPGIAAEQLVAARPREHHLDEAARPAARRRSSDSSARPAAPRGARPAAASTRSMSPALSTIS